MKLLLLLIITSCGLFKQKNSMPEGKKEYSYTDVSGRYRLVRESKMLNNKLVIRTQLLSAKGGNAKVLEKSVTLSHLGSIRGDKNRLLTLRPEASEFNVWLEGKNYSSKMNLDVKNRSLKISLKSPEVKWNGTSHIPFPRGKYFCYYSQVPECLYHLQFLDRILKNKKESLDFYIIWDSYPFIQDQLSGVGNKVFSGATLKYDGKDKKRIRFSVEVEGQIILYQFSNSFELVKIAWIAQGISVVPLGEELPESDLE